MTPLLYDNFTHKAVELKNIVWKDTNHITASAFAFVSANLRLYYTGNLSERWFDFCLVEFCAASGNFPNVWDDPDIEVEIVCAGSALFDGIRHLYIPYWHYASCADGIKLFQTLAELQEQFNIEDA